MKPDHPQHLSQQAITVREATDSDRQAWQDYVRSHPQATFFHRWEWRALMAEQWRHRPVFLIAWRGSAVCGVLPLAHMKTALFGSQLVSLPFCVYGGPLTSDPQALAELAVASGRQMELSWLDGAADGRLRAVFAAPGIALPEWTLPPQAGLTLSQCASSPAQALQRRQIGAVRSDWPRPPHCRC